MQVHSEVENGDFFNTGFIIKGRNGTIFLVGL
jgi:hypothetical protein